MNIHAAPASTADLRPAHTCHQCGTTYHAHRSTSRFCSPVCRLRNHRKPAPARPDVLRAWLLRRSFAGRVGPTTVALTVPLALALGDWNEWNPNAALTAEGFRARLKELAILFKAPA